MSQKMPNFGGIPQMTRREDGGMVFHVKNGDGEIKMTCYSVFPGIDLIYNDIHARESLTDITGNHRNLLEIDHCRDGRMECRVDGDSFYLAPGISLFIGLASLPGKRFFPHVTITELPFKSI